MSPIRTATVLTHRRPSETRPAIEALLAIAREVGAVLYVDPGETRKHRLVPGPGLEVDVEGRIDFDICFALWGDGTIMAALRR